MKRRFLLYKSRLGLSLVEILIGTILLAAAITPIFFFSSKSTKQAFDAKDRIIASEIGKAILARYMALEFNKCLQAFNLMEKQVATGELSFPIPVADDFMINEIINSSANTDLINDLNRDLKGMTYSIFAEFDQPVDPEEILIKIKISWPKTSLPNALLSTWETESVKFRGLL